jgi:hypothetical protein
MTLAVYHAPLLALYKLHDLAAGDVHYTNEQNAAPNLLLILFGSKFCT